MNLTPKQDAAAVAAAYLGSLAACIALICAIVDTGMESRQLAAKCINNGNSPELCSVRFYGR